jgi:hypothetical protein
MDAESQKRKIRRFIKGTINNGIDTFCIYQWIERCHFEGWWEMGVALGSHLQPNSLNKDYQKRLEFILSECRRNHDIGLKEADLDPVQKYINEFGRATPERQAKMLEELMKRVRKPEET